MTDRRIAALRGADPRGFLAAMGLLVHAGAGATLRFEGTQPVLDVEATPEAIAASLLADCSLGDGHPLEGDWCRATASAEGWRAVGAPRSWGERSTFGPAWTRMVRAAVWKEPGSKHALSRLWLNTASGKIGVYTQLRALVPVDGAQGKVSRDKVVEDLGALLDGRHPAPDGVTVLGLGASRASTNHTIELLTLVGGLFLPPGAGTPSGERGLTWCLWDLPLTAPQVYPVVRDPARLVRGTMWRMFAAPVVSPDTGSYAKVYGPASVVGQTSRRQRTTEPVEQGEPA